MEWNYYNYAMFPKAKPHEEVDTSAVDDGSVWKAGGGKTPFLARWTSDFDCGYETSWWYCIKDNQWDISTLKAKRKYEINKGRKNFEVKIINPIEYTEAMYNVQVAAFSAYPKKYRPKVDYAAFAEKCEKWDGMCFGAFKKNENGVATDQLCGYSHLAIYGQYIGFFAQKTNPQYERDGINAALIDGFLMYFNDDLLVDKYICDGARSINHETAFQDYLEKYFGFRKAYCKLHISYNPKIRWIIPIFYFFRKILRKADGIGVIHLINSVIQMEEIRRNCER